MKKDFYFQSSDGISRIHGVIWKPQGKPVGVLQLVHGMVEHIGRYDDFARYMAGQGFLVIGHDHLGHGFTAASPEDYGYMGEKQGFSFLLKDIHAVSLRAKAKADREGIPFFILGHSMGSMLLRRYLTIWGDLPDGAIIMGTGQYPRGLCEFGCALAWWICRIRGGRYRSPLLFALTNGSYQARYLREGNPGAWLSRDAKRIAETTALPCCHFRFTASAYYGLFSLMRDLAAKKDFGRIPRTLPVLLVSGMEDPVGGFTKGVLQVYNTFVAMGMEDVDIHLYKDDRHEILNELDREQVYDDICDWLQRRSRR